jgi:mycothiol synthase
VTVREPTLADAPALTDLLNAQWLALTGSVYLTPEVMRSWFGLPDLEMLVVEDEHGLGAYADFVPTEGTTWAWIDVRQHPDRPTAAEPLFEHFERRARELGRSGVRAIVAERDEATRSLAKSRGYRPIRYSFRMLIEHESEPSPPVFPDGLDLRVMRPGEERDVHAAFNDAFADSWEFHPTSFESFCKWNLERDGSRPDLWWLATDGEEIAGLCINRMSDDGDPEHGYVHLLGVRRPWRRHGLGEALLRHSFGDFWRRGTRRVSLDVDAENPTGALRLYERVGMHQVRRTDTYEKQLS